MKNKLTIDWLVAAAVRALKTVAQTALGMFTVGAALDEVNWKYVASVSLVAGIYSMLTSIATTLPEVSADGTLRIDSRDPEKEVFLFDFETDPEIIKDQKYLRMKVSPNAIVDQTEN